MWKALLAGTTALTLVGGSLVLAQQNPPSPTGRDNWRPRLSAEDRAALDEARIAGLKAGLKLTPAQEKNWPAVETALRDNAKQRSERFEQFRKQREQRQQQGNARDGNLSDRMRERADAMATRAASLKKLAEAIDPLYKSLDDGQKQRFALLYREGGRHHHMWFRGPDGPGPQMGPGPQGPDRRQGPRQRRTENEL